ncbi:MAG TPA: hypothetical protein VFM04_02765 [Candidatus Methylomirabilis sp.]|nr:hypothetical protein [Candidatus Methylomirabilis sp.]
MEPRALRRNKLLQVLYVLAVVMAVSLPGVAESTSHLQQAKASANTQLRIRGAKVSTEDQAERLASEAYFKRMGGKRAIQTAKVVSIHRLDVEIQGFSQKGDRVWEVRIYGARDLSAVIWVHSETAATKFLVP